MLRRTQGSWAGERNSSFTHSNLTPTVHTIKKRQRTLWARTVHDMRLQEEKMAASLVTVALFSKLNYSLLRGGMSLLKVQEVSET